MYKKPCNNIEQTSTRMFLRFCYKLFTNAQNEFKENNIRKRISFREVGNKLRVKIISEHDTNFSLHTFKNCLFTESSVCESNRHLTGGFFFLRFELYSLLAYIPSTIEGVCTKTRQLYFSSEFSLNQERYISFQKKLITYLRYFKLFKNHKLF